MPSYQDFESEALRIIEAARGSDITLRLVGALAIRIHCPKYCFLHEAFKRAYTDLDFVAYGRQQDQILKLFTGLGYSYDFRFMAMHGASRMIFENKAKAFHADVFYDKLEFCHTIELAKNSRLEVDYPTISVSDMLLEKMQIVQLTEKDIIDSTLLLLEHDVGDRDEETLNVDYLGKLLSQDWGFYYTVTTNLAKLKENIQRNEKIPPDQRTKTTAKIDTILDATEKAPKSVKWRMRSRVGPSKKWYTDVDDLRR